MISNAEWREIKLEFLKVNRIRPWVDVDVRFPRGLTECYTLPRARENCPSWIADYPYYVTREQIDKLAEKGGTGVCYGRSEWGPFCLLYCFLYRVKSIVRLSDQESQEYYNSIYGGDNEDV